MVMKINIEDYADLFEEYYEEEEERYVEPPSGTQALHNYGPFKKLGYYNIVDEGFDWYDVQYHGKLICVPKWVFEK